MWRESIRPDDNPRALSLSVMKPEKKSKPAKKPSAPAAKTSAKKPAAPKQPRKQAAPAQPAQPSARPAARKKASVASLPVPPILLEGDAAPAPLPGGPGQRFALSPLPLGAAAPSGADIELPDHYGSRRLFLTARDPHWLYAAWDFSSEEQQQLNAASRDGHLILKVLGSEAAGLPASEVQVHPESRHWFVHVPRGQTVYQCELGYRDAAGQWQSVALSAPALTPPDRAFAAAPATFATIPSDVTYQEILASVQAVAERSLPLTEAIREAQLQAETEKARASAEALAAEFREAARAGAAEEPSVPAAAPAPAPAAASAETRALAQVVRVDPARRVWIGEIEATELVRRQLTEQLSSAAAAEFSRPEASRRGHAAPPNISSPQFGFGQPGAEGAAGISSPMAPEEKGESGFWFNINAELVIYGATDPGATVKIGSRTVRLRPDGSFSFRFILPDGKFELAATAIAPDQSEQREARLSFSRSSHYRGEVLAHPQDPALKVPAAENAA